MTVQSIHPLLLGCQGPLSDLHASVEESGQQLALYAGTALLLRLPNDKQIALFRFSAVLLRKLGASITRVCAAFGICDHTLVRWHRCFESMDWEGLFSTSSYSVLSAEVRAWALDRFRQANCKRKLPDGFYPALLADLKRIWDLEVSVETLRRLFREHGSVDRHAPAAAEPESCKCTAEPAEKSAEAALPTELTAAVPTQTSDCAFPAPPDPSSEPPTIAHSNPNCVWEPVPSAPPVPPRADLLSHLQHPDINAHTGLLLAWPWFIKHLPAGLSRASKQTLLQFIAGAENQEQQARDFHSDLSEILGETTYSDAYYLRRLLDEAADDEAAETIPQCTLNLLKLHSGSLLYYDPHFVPYIGEKKLIFGWSSCQKSTASGYYLDFIHDRFGRPVFHSPYDAYYDARARFFMTLDQLRSIAPDIDSLTWVFDRGFWGKNFMLETMALGHHFIQWEKGYTSKAGAWHTPCIAEGIFTKIRERNNSKDTIRTRIRWREQPWTALPGVRRLLIRLRKSPDAPEIELSILTSAPGSAETHITAILNRWLQESNFAFLGRHAGINELTSRRFTPYESLADQLEDKHISTAEHKAHTKALKQAQKQLDTALAALGKDQLKASRDLAEKRAELTSKLHHSSAKLDQLLHRKSPLSAFDALRKTVQKLSRLIPCAQKPQAPNQAIVELARKVDQLKHQLAQVVRKESRLHMLAREGYSRPDFKRKHFLGKLQIHAQGIYNCLFYPFRGLCKNYRDDHAILHQLLAASGLIVPHGNHIDIYLKPKLTRQPHVITRIEKFLEIASAVSAQITARPLKFHIKSAPKKALAELKKNP